MNELVWAFPLTASVMWTCRPRPPVRRTAPTAPIDSPAPSVAGRRLRGPGRLSGRRRRNAPATLPLAHWCEGVARALRGGDTLRSAIAGTEPSEPARQAVEVVRRTIDRADDEAGRSDDPDLALVATVVSACLEHGGPAAEPLDRAAGVLRARAAERDERRVQSAQARMSAAVLTWLPIAMLVVLVVSSPSVRRAVTTPLGSIAVASGVVVNVVGWCWMRRVVDRAAR